jgi:hypothetical protein
MVAKETPLPPAFSSERPEIEFSKTIIKDLVHEHFYLKVKGKNLDECRKHFDELKKELI